MRTFVMRIWLEFNNAFLFQLVYNALNPLSMNTHRSSMPRD